jgi:hypothetical protein
MTNSQQIIQDKLNACAIIVRKYNLGVDKVLKFDFGDEKYFFDKFSNIDKKILRNAWTLALKEIQNREIIKDTSQLSSADIEQVNKKVIGFDTNSQTFLHYLKSNFDVRELKLTDENIERRTRNLIAHRYLELVEKEVSELSVNSKNSFKSKTGAFFNKFKAAFIILGIVGVFATPRIIDGLTPVDILTEKIHENSKYKFNGSICNDGHTSHSQGRGTCSWHGGVNYKFYKGDYSKTIEECREEAIKLSWRD